MNPLVYKGLNEFEMILQRMIVEMEEMASRPSAVITLEIERKYDSCVADKKDNNLELRKRKRVSASYRFNFLR